MAKMSRPRSPALWIDGAWATLRRKASTSAELEAAELEDGVEDDGVVGTFLSPVMIRYPSGSLR